MILLAAVVNGSLGASLESCRNRQLSIGVVAGVHKVPAILACLRARYVNVLITDELTAIRLLENVS